MDYEQRHPILQEIYEYLKNTPKEQVDEDWSYVFKETHPTESYYEQKYKEALEWMQSLYDGLHGATKEDAEHYFPELKESEDERIKKGLIKTVSSLLDNTILYHTDITKEEALAWLEKQGKEEYALKSFSDKDVHKFMQYIEKQAKAYEFNLPNRGYDIYAFAKDILIWLEKQGENKYDFSDLRVWKYIVDMVLTEKDGIGNYLDNPDTERIAKKLQEKYGNIEKQGNKLDADKVIAWLVANICDFEYYVNLFKEDFGL